MKVKWSWENYTINIEGYLPNESVPVMWYGAAMCVEGVPYGLPVPFKASFTMEQNPTYGHSLTNDEKAWVSAIMVQRFLREKGCQLGGKFLPMLACIVSTLARECQEHGFYKNSVDMRLTLADVCLNQEFGSEITEIVNVAEELEGKS